MDNIAIFIFGCLGLTLFLCIMFMWRTLLNSGESALLHLLICFVYVFWIPLPLGLTISNHDELFTVAMVFGYLFLAMMIFTMALQVGHLSYRNKQANDLIWDDRDSWMLQGMLGNVFESIVMVIFHIWTILLMIGFFVENNSIVGFVMLGFSLFMVRSLYTLISVVVRRPVPILKIGKTSAIVTNLEIFLFFVIVMCLIRFD